MTFFGLKESEVAHLVRSVSQLDLDREQIADRFARCAWSGIAEPGDGVAGTLVASVGAARALTAVIERPDAATLASMSDGHLDERDARLALDRWIPRLDAPLTLARLGHAVRLGVRLTVPGDAAWLSGADDLGPHAPFALWLRGRADAVAAIRASVAIVGARAATGYGEHVATEWSGQLAQAGAAVVSGAAYGIDGAAHRAALAHGGLTVAVLAGGPDRFYPSGHDTLLTRIASQGCIVTELPCGSSPTKWRFLQRNRIIAAISHATVVVEAGARSGSLNTAAHAASLGRPVAAVPGPVTSSASMGCHRLVREFGATLVSRVDDVAELVPHLAMAASTVAPPIAREDPRHTRVLDALASRTAREIDDIAVRSGLSLADVRAALGELELEGHVNDTGRGWSRTR